MSSSTLTKEYVISEVKKLQFLYRLKNEIRYAEIRHEKDSTESVAEHVYGMHVIASYFLPLIDLKSELDKSRIYEMITIHDMDEIETGDILGYLKNDIDRENEAAAMQKVISGSPLHMQLAMKSLSEEYNNQQTIESKFVKAVDKFEPLIQIYNEKGKQVLRKNKTTADQAESIKEPYLKEFPVMYNYYKIIHQTLVEEEYFYKE